MARQIIKQPNGKYCEYSTIVDAFVTYDATADELIQNARAEAADDAERRYMEAIAKADEGIVRGRLALTFQEALSNHNKHCPIEDRI